MPTEMKPLRPAAYAQVYRFLDRQEPWHMIALDALITHGLHSPGHHWYAEVEGTDIRGIVYLSLPLVHVAYPQVPDADSPLYPFLRQQSLSFNTFGHQPVVEGVLRHLRPFHKQLLEKSDFVVQTKQTQKRLRRVVPVPHGVGLRWAGFHDYWSLVHLFQGSDVEEQVDLHLVRHLLRQQRIYVAQTGDRLAGCMMSLKETSRYVLLGNLYVLPSERKKGIATLLGQQMILHYLRLYKKVCFYYSQPELKTFYDRAAFRSIGKWVHYSVIVKETS